MENIFSSFSINMPLVYQEKIKNFVSGSIKQLNENKPFERQVDFWYLALCLAFSKGLEPHKEKDVYTAVTAEILSRDPYRIIHLQMIALSSSEDVNILLKPKEMFDICCGYANAGIPLLISILSSPDTSPLWALYEELEQ
ncbi:hypothetical protein [Aeromonas veronii]|uniref:hypothetical protein n=1 Tax=Aeromonas veronii TaxID=654 RepID=UPI001115E129|nr:hypothetical protein [Aeromonas veronii]